MFGGINELRDARFKKGDDEHKPYLIGGTYREQQQQEQEQQDGGDDQGALAIPPIHKDAHNGAKHHARNSAHHRHDPMARMEPVTSYT